MKHNRFYSGFDTQTLGEPRKKDYRSAFQVDRDRLIHSHAFRKLQSKTQVFLSGEYDFYRTRLTHSMEVAQIGRSICHYLASEECPSRGLLAPDFYIDDDLVEAICLAHDLGHPPFGHSGERTLQEIMRDHGGFEGNAQTLRLLGETIFESETAVRGMQPTRALTDGVLKYKKLYREFTGSEAKPTNHFLYDYQEKQRSFVFANRKIPGELHDGLALNAFKSVECQIMDWADDAAYSLNDIVDGVKAGFLTIERIEAWAEKTESHWTAQTGPLKLSAKARGDCLRKLIDGIRADKLERMFAAKIGTFVRATRLKERINFMSSLTNRYRFELTIAPAAVAEAEFYKKMANDIIFESPQLQQIEYKARRVLHTLWEAAWENYVEPPQARRAIKVIPIRAAHQINEAKTREGKARCICDWLAGLTDGMIVRTYRRLVDPEFGSIRDLS
ncbi:dGTPase [Ereboglobus sp. PH5-5]|uniref:dGTP triphosphohydrolase n=1 Tax=Ereboglobus sp. PH5-5 TaxID=2940529 RepID=UPI002405334D|nr:dNTP triphosphohydrolase [Ereboglobus sp. PH5-5]MDF9834005.1 dGTPase [Ereboglobus sp. PH5-5]